MRILAYKKQIICHAGIPYINGPIGLFLRNDSLIEIGHSLRISSGGFRNPLGRNIESCIMLEPNAHLMIGNNVGISNTTIWVHSKISIGDRTNIGADCIIMDSDAHSLNYLDRRDPSYLDKQNKINSPIVIEEDVLVGARTIILKGVVIGARSIIGAGSVVTRSIPADSIAAGNPCKVIKINDSQL